MNVPKLRAVFRLEVSWFAATSTQCKCLLLTCSLPQGHEVYDINYHNAKSKPSLNDHIYDVKFCPFIPLGEDPVFAAISGRSIKICRISKNKNALLEVVKVIVDDDEEEVAHNSVAWIRGPTNGEPLIAFAGNLPNIQIVDVESGTINRSLFGHGQPVNDIVVCPTLPTTIATCSQDHSIRLWNLKPEYAKFPCSVVCAGAGHSMSVESIDFHQTGRFLLSGGDDTYVHLWVIPEAHELEQLPKVSTGEREVAKRIHFPHFSTADLHSNNVDRVQFYGDLILSRAVKEDKILLWKIDGFNSSDAIPEQAPTEQGVEVLTRSAFGNGFHRLMQFSCKDTEQVWMRFTLFHNIGQDPILSMGNNWAGVYFWNLRDLEGEKGDSGYHGNLFQSVEPHGSVAATRYHGKGKKHDVIRAIAWAPDGKWCCGGGDNGNLLLCSR
ncbi:WD40 repeat-like protein [Tothia fuscella]|uniref:WD40 repeat-like protein n=1 Tax=Tothia fuscella TaxID=1048955 RepID=A0A9P4NYM4_9PEZI|nr:WD40 repeat-like protein [Tothia fuscella]